MASSSSSKPNPDNETIIVTVTQHEFNQFHKIDRILFTRLVLLHWPDPSLNDPANEAILAFNCIKSDHFPYDANIIGVLPLTQSVTQKCVTTHYLHENRDEIFDDANELLRSIEEERMNNIVPRDERTIFLTFSKGYPISEAEVRDYFSRRFGDIIEGIYMQEVNLMEQPLYARLVVRSNAINVIDVFLEGTGKVKFCINRKHVWAWKYVRKSPSPSPGRLAFM
ncbi:uncharacterized protein G2W53_032580 [Senna tora]|uniref:Uncharacterized protein n=1 Tax=Senna tora TaxID=362788 RepID=A0A834T814_9FABA|nr:uncharacterized protein G2W53_032580 [Senna tora]